MNTKQEEFKNAVDKNFDIDYVKKLFLDNTKEASYDFLNLNKKKKIKET